MIIGIDNVEMDSNDTLVDLSKYTDLEEKYVVAVNHKIDILITNNPETAKYFKDNNIPTFIQN